MATPGGRPGLYRDAPILIADEPSAALDPRAEHALFRQLRAHPDRAVVLITHRLANVRHADHIYVLHHGRLVEAGTHAQLLAAGGRYAELFTLQASGYVDPSGSDSSVLDLTTGGLASEV